MTMEYRDGAVFRLIADDDVRRVLEYMQSTMPAQKLIGIAQSLPEMAKLLWSEFPQEPVAALTLRAKLPSLNTPDEKQRVAI